MAVHDTGTFAPDLSSVDIHWVNHSKDAERVIIERGDSAGGSVWRKIGEVAPNVTSFHDSGLLANTIYQYRVYAQNSADSPNSDKSDEPAADKRSGTYVVPFRRQVAVTGYTTSSGNIDNGLSEWGRRQSDFTIDPATSAPVYNGTSHFESTTWATDDQGDSSVDYIMKDATQTAGASANAHWAGTSHYWGTATDPDDDYDYPPEAIFEPAWYGWHFPAGFKETTGTGTEADKYRTGSTYKLKTRASVPFTYQWFHVLRPLSDTDSTHILSTQTWAAGVQTTSPEFTLDPESADLDGALGVYFPTVYLEANNLPFGNVPGERQFTERFAEQ